MVLVIYLSLTFGWVGSPGNYGAFSALHAQYFQAAQPPDPLWHTGVPYHDKTLVDDTILVEPDLGLRPTLPAWWAEETLCRVFGPNAINSAKHDEEGAFATESVIWGGHLRHRHRPCDLPKA